MKKLIFLTFSCLVIISATQAQSDSSVFNYINQYKELAIEEMIRTGVPASITLAQGIVETNAGQSSLVKESNNHFGIKCKTEWTGSVVYYDDDSKHECFRSYTSAEDSYRDHSDFLKNRPNYGFLFQLDPTDYQAWAFGLKKAGYATSNVYAQALIRMIENYSLQDYTYIALDRINNPVFPADTLITATVRDQNDGKLPVPGTPASAAIVITPSKSAVQIASYPDGVFTINGTKVVYAHQGSSLFALASIYGVNYKKMLEFNEMDNKDILAADCLIYLEKKPKLSNKTFHIVRENEQLEDIAREEGVQLSSLVAMNNVNKGSSLKAGDKIWLRTEGKKGRM